MQRTDDKPKTAGSNLAADVAETVSKAASGEDRPMTKAETSGLVFLTYPLILIVALAIAVVFVSWWRT